MTTFHIYKTDCVGSSRVMLQSGWEGGRSVFIHRAKLGRPPTGVLEKPYTLGSILWAMSQAKLAGQARFVFHAQSALPMLLLAYALRRLFGASDALFVYDIHDLHESADTYRSMAEKIRFGIFRYHILAFLEAIVLRFLRIQTLTVSDGLSQAISKRYACPAPVVVQSAMAPRFDADALKAMPRNPKALLFFGTIERLPVELIDDIGSAGFELHLYGRFDGEAVETQYGRTLPNHVKVFGEYSPNNLDFISRYSYLLIFKPSDQRINFRHSLPNKMFQAIGFGLSLIISKNFEEMIETLAPVSGAIVVLESTSALAEAMFKLEQERNEKFWVAVSELSNNLHDQAKNAYLYQIGHEQK